MIADQAFKRSAFLTRLESITRDADTLRELYREAIETFIQYLNVATTLFLIAYDLMLLNFKDLVSNLESQGPILADVAVIIVAIIGLWSQFFGIKPLIDKEFDPKMVLAELN